MAVIVVAVVPAHAFHSRAAERPRIAASAINDSSPASCRCVRPSHNLPEDLFDLEPKPIEALVLSSNGQKILLMTGPAGSPALPQTA